jgi:hypothetical protein
MSKQKARSYVLAAAALAFVAGCERADVDAEKKAVGRTEGPQDMRAQTKGAPSPEADESGVVVVFDEQALQMCRLRDRVEQRWHALIKRDFAAAYAYETPAYREENSLERFAAQFGTRVSWHIATVKQLRYDRADEATAAIALNYSFDLPTDEVAQTTSRIREQWVRVDNEWWHRDNRRPLGGGK